MLLALGCRPQDVAHLIMSAVEALGGIRGAAARRFRPVTTNSRHGLPVAPDLLGQAFQVAEPNRV